MGYVQMDNGSLVLVGETLIFNSVVLFLWLGLLNQGRRCTTPAKVILLYVHSSVVT